MAASRLRAESLAEGACGSTLDVTRSYPVAELLRRPVVLEPAAIGDNEKEQSLVTALILQTMTEHYKANRPGGSLSHVTVIEEAHRLLGRPLAQSGDAKEGNAQARAAQAFANTLAENLKYGEGVVIVEQVPGKLVEDAYKNTNLKVMHRLPAAADRELIGGTMRFSPDQERYAATLEPFHAFAHHDRLDRPALITVPDVRAARPGRRAWTGPRWPPPLNWPPASDLPESDSAPEPRPAGSEVPAEPAVVEQPSRTDATQAAASEAPEPFEAEEPDDAAEGGFLDWAHDVFSGVGKPADVAVPKEATIDRPDFNNVDLPGIGPLIEYGTPLDRPDGTRLPLFDGPPAREQTQQGMLDDCGVIATMGAVAGHRPELISQCIRENDDGTYEVTLHQTKHSFEAGPRTGRRRWPAEGAPLGKLMHAHILSKHVIVVRRTPMRRVRGRHVPKGTP